MSERACVKAWTGVVHLKEDRLPDLAKWREEFAASVGELFTLHGVEATLDGRLLTVRGELALEVSKDLVVRLQPLKVKVQWDRTKNGPQAMTESEKEAHRRLCDRFVKHAGSSPRVRVTGPLLESAQGAASVLTVREYVWE